MTLSCTRCARKIPARYVDLDRVICQCHDCGNVFGFEDQVEPLEDPHPFAQQRLAIPCPAGITVDDRPERLRIVVPWMSPALWWRLVGGSVFGLFLLGTMLNVIGATPFAGLFIVWVLGLTPLAIGFLGGIYIVLVHFLNQTVIEVDRERLRARSGPLPWQPDCRLRVENIDQLYCRAHPLLGLFQRNQYCHHQTYDLVARREDGATAELLRGMIDPDHVWFVEQRIEDWLGIVDRHVRGEFR